MYLGGDLFCYPGGNRLSMSGEVQHPDVVVEDKLTKQG